MTTTQTIFFWFGVLHAVFDVAVIGFLWWFCRQAKLQADRLENDGN